MVACIWPGGEMIGCPSGGSGAGAGGGPGAGPGGCPGGCPMMGGVGFLVDFNQALTLFLNLGKDLNVLSSRDRLVQLSHILHLMLLAVFISLGAVVEILEWGSILILSARC